MSRLLGCDSPLLLDHASDRRVRHRLIRQRTLQRELAKVLKRRHFNLSPCKAVQQKHARLQFAVWRQV